MNVFFEMNVYIPIDVCRMSPEFAKLRRMSSNSIVRWENYIKIIPAITCAGKKIHKREYHAAYTEQKWDHLNNSHIARWRGTNSWGSNKKSDRNLDPSFTIL